MRTTIDIKLTGSPTKMLSEVRDRLAKNAEVAVLEAAKVIFKTSQVYVPVVSGTLRSSGEVLHTPKGLDSEAGVGYGLDPSYSKPWKGRDLYPYFYAVRVHELMTAGPISQKQNDYLNRAVENEFVEAGNLVLQIMKR